jgi:hypothetical protein
MIGRDCRRNPKNCCRQCPNSAGASWSYLEAGDLLKNGN